MIWKSYKEFHLFHTLNKQNSPLSIFEKFRPQLRIPTCKSDCEIHWFPDADLLHYNYSLLTLGSYFQKIEENTSFDEVIDNCKICIFVIMVMHIRRGKHSQNKTGIKKLNNHDKIRSWTLTATVSCLYSRVGSYI